MVPKETVFVVANPSNLMHRIKLCNMLQHHFEALSRRDCEELVPKKTKTIWRTQVRKFHFASICNVLPCEPRLFWYSTRVLNRHLANKLRTNCQQSAASWQKIFVKAVNDSRPTVGRLSANSWPTVGRLSFDCRSTVVRLLADNFLGELFFIFSAYVVTFHVELFSNETITAKLLFFLLSYHDLLPLRRKQLFPCHI